MCILKFVGGLQFCSFSISSKCKYEVKSEVPDFLFSMSTVYLSKPHKVPLYEKIYIWLLENILLDIVTILPKTNLSSFLKRKFL